MIDQEKAGKGRMWGYAAGIVLFVVVVAWKYLTR